MAPPKKKQDLFLQRGAAAIHTFQLVYVLFGIFDLFINEFRIQHLIIPTKHPKPSLPPGLRRLVNTTAPRHWFFQRGIFGEDDEGCQTYTYTPEKTTRWWFQLFLMFTPILGEMIQFDEHIFHMGWNHHLD